jgi:hypothetical protein
VKGAGAGGLGRAVFLIHAIPPEVVEVSCLAYSRGPWRYRAGQTPARPLTRGATSIDTGGIKCNPTSTMSGGSKKGQIWLNFENEFILR